MGVLSGFQLDKYEIHKLMIEIPPDYHVDQEDSINYLAKLITFYRDDQWHGSVMIGFQQTSENNPSKTLYEVIIVGDFHLSGENDESTKNAFKTHLKGSGAATLIPIARAALVSASAITGHPGLCSIPNINVFQLEWHDADSDEVEAKEDA